MKLKLIEPITIGSEKIEVLEFRKAKAKDLRKLPSNPDTGDILNLAGRLCGQPPSTIDELGIEDTKAMLEAVSNFLGNSQKTGDKD